MIKKLFLFLSSSLLITMNVFASDKGWSEEKIKTALVQGERFSELDRVDALCEQGFSADEIAAVLELGKPVVNMPTEIVWSQDSIEMAARSKGNVDLLASILEGYNGKPDYNEIAGILGLSAHDYVAEAGLPKEQGLSDEEMAQLLNYHLDLNGDDQPSTSIANIGIPQVEIKKELMLALEAAIGESKVYNHADVHGYNKKFVNKHRPLYDQICAALNLKNNISVNALLAQLPQDMPASFKASLVTLGGHNLNITDAETKLRIDHVLSCVADLCDRIVSLPHVRINPYVYVAESLAENIETNGGCKPGYAGRFFRDFLYLSSVYLNNCKIV